MRRISSSDPGRVAYSNVTLRSLVMRAWQVRDYQISGPDWLASERYDVAAKLPENTPNRQVPLMLQALLAERFELALHHEQREMPGYALAVAKGGFKLKPVNESPGGINLRIGSSLRGMQGRLTLAGLANVLAGFIGGPVEDTTRIEGTFEINLEWFPDDRETGLAGPKFAAREPGAVVPDPGVPLRTAPEAPSGPSLFAAVQSLGLRLEPRKAPVDILVIDRAEKAPVEN